jgi:hypothetical protein
MAVDIAIRLGSETASKERYQPTNRGLVQAELQEARRGDGAIVVEIVRVAGLWGVQANHVHTQRGGED